MMKLNTILKLAPLLALVAGPVIAQESPQPLEAVLGAGILLTPPGDLKRIAVVDENVASVTLLSAQEALINGKSVGRTTLFVWLVDGQRLNYDLKVSRDLTGIQKAMKELDERIAVEETHDGQSVLLKGTVDSAEIAAQACSLVTAYLSGAGSQKATLLNLLNYPLPPADRALQESLRTIDPRIRPTVVASEKSGDKQTGRSIILEGAVGTIQDLLKAVTLAERYLGETGGIVKAPQDSRVSNRRFRGLFSSSGGGGAGGGQNNLRALEMGELSEPGLAAQVSRGLVVASESGRVISFLEVDRIQQVLVSIRVLEIDRGRARSMGINYTVDGTHFSLGRFNNPPLTRFDNARPVAVSDSANPSLSALTAGNLVGAYVSSSVAVLGAMELLQEHSVARSVAEPNVLTLTGEEASVVIGGEVPIPTTAMGNVATVRSYFFQTFGVRLDIRPTVGEGDIVTLEVAPSIVKPDSGLGTTEVPGFQVQSVQTVARVKQGESLILGGLLTHEENIRESSVPILGHIPILGYLFKSKEKGRAERELLFVITPTLLSDSDGVEGIQEPVELPAIEPFDDPRWETFVPPARMDDGRPASWQRPLEEPELAEEMEDAEAIPSEPGEEKEEKTDADTEVEPPMEAPDGVEAQDEPAGDKPPVEKPVVETPDDSVAEPPTVVPDQPKVAPPVPTKGDQAQTGADADPKAEKLPDWYYEQRDEYLKKRQEVDKDLMKRENASAQAGWLDDDLLLAEKELLGSAMPARLP